MSSFVSSMLNLLSDVGVKSIFTTTSSPIVSLEHPTPIMTPSTIATITTSEYVNATLEAEVLTRSSHSSRTSYAIAADLSEMELRKILIEKMEGNKEDDDQEGPSAGPNRGSKRQKEGGEQASASTPSKKETKGAGGSTTGSQSR
nr:hypothetical protein [Tanacetum cinerariifolium]